MPSLTRHPATPCDAVSAIEAEATRQGPRLLLLAYRVRRGPGDLAIPPLAAPARADGLWKHTCFEAFVRAPGSRAYFEFNLAPSCEWAAYGFSGYREGVAALDIPPPLIVWRPTPQGWELTTDLDLAGLDELPAGGAWEVSLTAVVEEAQGRTSYWALAHPPARPDFHADAGFALTLPGPTPT